jgi:hypothetical protein
MHTFTNNEETVEVEYEYEIDAVPQGVYRFIHIQKITILAHIDMGLNIRMPYNLNQDDYALVPKFEDLIRAELDREHGLPKARSI